MFSLCIDIVWEKGGCFDAEVFIEEVGEGVGNTLDILHISLVSLLSILSTFLLFNLEKGVAKSAYAITGFIRMFRILIFCLRLAGVSPILCPQLDLTIKHHKY